MKIGICCHPTVGGSGVVATELAHALAGGGDEVHLMSYAVPARWAGGSARLFFHEVTVGQYPLFEYPPYSLALATKIVDVVRHHDLDLIHVHYAIPNAVSAILARQILERERLRVITTLHGTDVTLVGNDPSYLETTRFSIRESDAVTAVSESLRRATHEQLDDGCEICVIPNFIDPSRYLEVIDTPGARGWAQAGEKVLVHTSNFRRVKRPLDVVEIFQRVAAEMPARLLLVGDGPEMGRVEARAEELGLAERVVWLGTVAEIERVLVHADLFLLPSETESFGLAALEALSCEVPVVASRVGGLPEVVVDGENGRLCPVGDVDAMASAALEILGDEKRRHAMGRAGRLHAVKRFDRADVVRRYRNLYEETLAAAGRG